MMSNALAIAAVTAALKDLIGTGLLGLDLSAIGSVNVSALPPDRIATGQTEPNQLNWFLYQVTPNSGWRNQMLPARDLGGARVSNPPLALDLHYMLTAYGAEDLGAEALLGFAMQFLHETPMLSRAQLRAVLGPPNPPFGNLSALSIADQIEWLKITPMYLGSEELSKLWTAMQARYRPSMAYQVSVVLIEPDTPARAPLPVLKRGAADRGPHAMGSLGPLLSRARPAVSELLPSARLGDELLLIGSRLSLADASVRLEHSRRETPPRDLAPTALDSPNAMRVPLPDVADAGALAEWSPGLYTVRVRTAPSGVPVTQSNAVPLVLSPTIMVSPLAAAPGDVTLTVECRPRLLASQHAGVRLLFGAREVAADTIDTPADDTLPTTLTFEVADATAGSHPVRLRVDGIDSLPVLLAANGALDFDPQQTVVIA
jgi:hypothetical protein